MAQTNPFGTVALGQEGSGLAQILKPYDAAKYDEALIAQKQKEKEDTTKALKEEKKEFKKNEYLDPKIYWDTDNAIYSKGLNDLYDEAEQLTMNYIKLSNEEPQTPEDRRDWRNRINEH